MAKVKDIFLKQGYAYNKDNRNRDHRSLQSLLDTGLISFSVCEKGKVFIGKDGFKYNMSVFVKNGDKWTNHRRKSSITNIDTYDVLKMVGQVLQRPDVKEVIKSYVDIDYSCQKCNGVGIIPAFMFYCDGICFDCFGLGFNGKFKPVVEILK